MIDRMWKLLGHVKGVPQLAGRKGKGEKATRFKCLDPMTSTRCAKGCKEYKGI